MNLQFHAVESPMHHACNCQFPQLPYVHSRQCCPACMRGMYAACTHCIGVHEILVRVCMPPGLRSSCLLCTSCPVLWALQPCVKLRHFVMTVRA